jgi:hypothetical protein
MRFGDLGGARQDKKRDSKIMQQLSFSCKIGPKK